jgi:hypothetical protein
MDFLVEKCLMPYCADRIITFRNCSNGNKKARMNQVNMCMAYLAAKKLCTEENLVLQFTYYIDNFMSCMSNNKMKLLASMSDYFNFIVLCSTGDIRKLPGSERQHTTSARASSVLFPRSSPTFGFYLPSGEFFFF